MVVLSSVIGRRKALFGDISLSITPRPHAAAMSPSLSLNVCPLRPISGILIGSLSSGRTGSGVLPLLRPLPAARPCYPRKQSTPRRPLSLELTPTVGRAESHRSASCRWTPEARSRYRLLRPAPVQELWHAEPCSPGRRPTRAGLVSGNISPCMPCRTGQLQGFCHGLDVYPYYRVQVENVPL